MNKMKKLEFTLHGKGLEVLAGAYRSLGVAATFLVNATSH